LAEWQGGIDFLRMIGDALRLSIEGDPPDMVLLYPRLPTLAAAHQVVLPWRKWLADSVRQGRIEPWRELLAQQMKQSSFARIARVKEAVGELPVFRFRNDEELASVARRERLDCLLPAFRPLASCVATPWVGYLYDFQHRHLPHLFNEAERVSRDAHFAAMAGSARQVIVNSRSVAGDCLHFLGGQGANIVPLPFGAAPMPDWLVDRPALLAKYDLPKRYFLVSNQFWTHKNHRLVFEALGLLAQEPEAAEVAVVCTGSTTDSRDPGYFPSLRRFLDERGLAGRVRILDLIAKRDQIEIMKRAMAVIQPTLFEGGPGGGAVYDAVSLGVPALVSDIPVNRELGGLGFAIKFFAPQDAAALSALMLDQIRSPEPVRKDAATLVAEGLARRRAVGQVLLATLKAAGASAS
jgi:glycosyltransferase involved in cell wall biosynthesis